MDSQNLVSNKSNPSSKNTRGSGKHILKSIIIYFLKSLECQLPTYVGDGYCHDFTNNRECGFDGGDCCGSCVNKEYCSDCECRNGVDLGIRNALVGDGFCHDLTNNAECNFDGGDCCGSCVNTKYCIHCNCSGEHTGDAKNNAFLGNGFCQDEYNHADCNYDGFDCCANLYLFKEYCSECLCKQGIPIVTLYSY